MSNTIYITKEYNEKANMMDIDKQVRLQTIKFLSEEDLRIGNQELVKFLKLFDPSIIQGSFSYILPMEGLVLYIMERLYYLPKMIQLSSLRTKLIGKIKRQLLQSSIINEIDSNLDKRIQTFVEQGFNSYYLTYSNFSKISSLFSYFSNFMHFFLQLANPSRRYAELTYIFIYERTAKFETLLKLDDRVNLIITKLIDEIEYIQLVYDSTVTENLLLKLPSQFLKPKFAMILNSMPETPNFNTTEFEPDFIVFISEKFVPPMENKTAYFIKYGQKDYRSFFLTTNSERLDYSEIQY